MRRMTPEDRRTAIVDAALAVAIRKGIATTTVRDVAAEMGTSSGLIHHYFETMDDVLAAAFRSAAREDLARSQAAADDAVDAVGKLAAFFDSYAIADQDWAFQLWLDAWAEAGRRPAIRSTSQQLNVEWQQLVAGIVRGGVTDGVFACDDPDGLAWRVLSLLDGLALQVVAHGALLTRSQAIGWTAKYAERELGLTDGSIANALLRK
jgi:AcrR family transcriptional regulator